MSKDSTSLDALEQARLKMRGPRLNIMNDFSELPIAEPYGIDDGYCVVGTGFDCKSCGRSNKFVTLWKGDTIECQWCNQPHNVLTDYDY